jgi:hypothetical protein
VRVASLETGFSFKTSVEESEQPASTSRHASFGERFLFDLASFDERFAGGDISVAETDDQRVKLLKHDAKERWWRRCHDQRRNLLLFSRLF